MSNKLPVSRFQRDLTDSTVLRNIGSIFGHILISFDNLLCGLKKIQPNITEIENELNNNYSVLSEALMIILRKNKVENSYELIKSYFRNNESLNKDNFKLIVDKLPINEDDKNRLRNLNHHNYIGNAANI